MNHPDPSMLVRFMRCELPRDEMRAVVRHLLARCQECSVVTRRLWGGKQGLKRAWWFQEEWHG